MLAVFTALITCFGSSSAQISSIVTARSIHSFTESFLVFFLSVIMIQAAAVVRIVPPSFGGDIMPEPGVALVQGSVMPDANDVWRHVQSKREVHATGNLRESVRGYVQFEAVDAETGEKSWYNAHKYIYLYKHIKHEHLHAWICSCGKDNWQRRVECRGCGLARPTNSADTPRPVAAAHFEVSCR